MLALTRFIGKKLIIRDDITIAVLGINGHHVRIKLNAPKDTSMYREEIYRRIKQEELDGLLNLEQTLKNSGDVLTVGIESQSTAV